MEWYEGEVAALEASRSGAPLPANPIVFYGSSSIRLWATLTEDFPTLPVVNAGFGGSTLAACAYFFERLVVPLRPRSLLLYAGDNDLGDGRSPAGVAESLTDLLGRLDHNLPGTRLGFLSIKPSPARWHLQGAIRESNDRARAILASRPGNFVIDVHGPMLGPGGYPRPELYADDGLHLSPLGYDLWRAVVDGHRAKFA